MKLLSTVLMTLALAAPALATDTVEDLMTQITYSGKVGDRKVFSSDAVTLLDIGLKFPTEFAKITADGGHIYWVQMTKIPVRNEGGPEQVDILQTTLYATNQICRTGPMCRQPAKADFQILTILQEHRCDPRRQDAPCSVELVSNGIRTKTMDALFWLSGKPLDE